MVVTAAAAGAGQQQQQVTMQESKPPIGIYPASSVRDVAESIHLDRLSDETCQAVAGDVEYRLNLIVQEAAKFMRHARRTTLIPADIDHALKALNVQPTLQPAHPLYKPQFAGVYPTPNDVPAGSQQLYFLKDEEVDLAAYLKSSHVLPAARVKEGRAAGVRWKAHWLAVEGVQPLIPENPISQIAESSSTALGGVGGVTASSSAGALMAAAAGGAPAKTTQQILAKAQLSQELQLLFTRITECLVPNPAVHAVVPETTSTAAPTTPATPAASTSSRSEFSQAEKARQAALATLSNDPSLGELLPYLIRWLTENVNNALASKVPQSGKGRSDKSKDARTTTEVGYLLDGVNAVLSNEHLFVEPYLHQLLPAVLSVLLAESLHVEPSIGGDRAPSERGTKDIAADLLETLLKNFAGEYDSLLPRVSRVLCRALHETSRSATRYTGALLGIQALGKQAVKASLLGNQASLLRHLAEGKAQQEVLELALDILAKSLDAREEADAMEQETASDDDELRDKLGQTLCDRLATRPRLKATILGAMQGL